MIYDARTNPVYKLTSNENALEKLANSLADEMMEEYEGMQQDPSWDWDESREYHLEEQAIALETLPVVVIELLMNHYKVLDQLQKDGMTDRERECYEDQPIDEKKLQKIADLVFS